MLLPEASEGAAPGEGWRRLKIFGSLFVGVSLEGVNRDDVVLNSNEREPLKRESDTSVREYGAGSSEGWRTVRTEGWENSRSGVASLVESIRGRSQEGGPEVRRTNSAGETDPGKSSHSNVGSKSVLIPSSILNHVGTESFSGTENLLYNET